MYLAKDFCDLLAKLAHKNKFLALAHRGLVEPGI